MIIDEVIVGILKIGKPIRYYTDGNNYYRVDIDGIGEIKSLHIKKEYQGRGIGSLAITFAENRLRELNYTISHLWVKQQNTKAIEFYKHMGYLETTYVNPNTNDGFVLVYHIISFVHFFGSILYEKRFRSSQY